MVVARRIVSRVLSPTSDFRTCEKSNVCVAEIFPVTKPKPPSTIVTIIPWYLQDPKTCCDYLETCAARALNTIPFAVAFVLECWIRTRPRSGTHVQLIGKHAKLFGREINGVGSRNNSEHTSRFLRRPGNANDHMLAIARWAYGKQISFSHRGTTSTTGCLV